MGALDNDDWDRILVNAKLPLKEQFGIYNLGTLLRALETHVKDFEAALKLFDLWAANRRPRSHSDHPYAGWGDIAGRDGAMTVFHFGDTMEAAKELLRAAFPTISARADWKVIRGISKSFYKEFPWHEQLRDAVAHIAEHVKNAEQARKNSLRDHPRIIYSVGFRGREYLTSHKGNVVSYELSPKSLAALRDLKRQFTDAIKEASAPLK